MRKNDLGYHLWPTTFNGGGFLWFAIEGETSQDPAYAERCIDLFIAEVVDSIEALSTGEFDNAIRDIRQTRESAPSSFYNERNKIADDVLYQAGLVLEDSEHMS